MASRELPTRAFPASLPSPSPASPSTSSYSIHDKALINFEGTDNLSWTQGNHAFKFGVDFIRDVNNQNYLPNNLYGSFSFTGRYSGSAYADFLLGLPQTTGLSNPAPSSYLRGNMWSFYAQDQFKVTPRLTLNYGVRWELTPPYTDKFGRIFNYSPAAGALVVPDKGHRVSSIRFSRRPSRF